MAYFQNIYHSDLSHRARSVYMGLSRSTVKRALDDLYGAGLLTSEPRWRENGSLSSNLYRLV